MDLPYEIREISDQGGGLRLELLVEGKRTGIASASVEMLERMKDHLGVDKQRVAEELRRVLEDLLKNRLDKVSVTYVAEDPTRPLKFHAKYTYRDHDHVDTGLVWYDVSASTTGPDGLPAVVRNKMRLEVHRKLTDQDSTARALVDLHE